MRIRFTNCLDLFYRVIPIHPSIFRTYLSNTGSRDAWSLSQGTPRTRGANPQGATTHATDNLEMPTDAYGCMWDVFSTVDSMFTKLGSFLYELDTGLFTFSLCYRVVLDLTLLTVTAIAVVVVAGLKFTFSNFSVLDLRQIYNAKSLFDIRSRVRKSCLAKSSWK